MLIRLSTMLKLVLSTVKCVVLCSTDLYCSQYVSCLFVVWTSFQFQLKIAQILINPLFHSFVRDTPILFDGIWNKQLKWQSRSDNPMTQTPLGTRHRTVAIKIRQSNDTNTIRHKTQNDGNQDQTIQWHKHH